MTYRIWFGTTYRIRTADSEEAALKTVPRRQRAHVTKVELVRPSSEWRAS